VVAVGFGMTFKVFGSTVRTVTSDFCRCITFLM
jgi:hypothetical protein